MGISGSGRSRILAQRRGGEDGGSGSSLSISSLLSAALASLNLRMLVVRLRGYEETVLGRLNKEAGLSESFAAGLSSKMVVIHGVFELFEETESLGSDSCSTSSTRILIPVPSFSSGGSCNSRG